MNCKQHASQPRGRDTPRVREKFQMALLDSTARRQAPEPVPVYRTAPHNIEAEQALLGAILINNEAFYRVSDFLEPGHFFERLHQTIFELASSLIRAGKVATPVTLKTF